MIALIGLGQMAGAMRPRLRAAEQPVPGFGRDLPWRQMAPEARQAAAVADADAGEFHRVAAAVLGERHV